MTCTGPVFIVGVWSEEYLSDSLYVAFCCICGIDQMLDTVVHQTMDTN